MEDATAACGGDSAGGGKISDIPGAEAQLGQLLREEYRLTKKETEIAIRLIRNERQAAIVEALNISPNTFKTHRRRIYEKMGTARQIDLVAEGHRLWDRAVRNYGPGGQTEGG